ncbi:hypothetical protein GLOIN_2v1876960 [Rhizophagus irregularis DAOM 181602=DAOM 197198]|nr:hypothetical protein GLOIN_2v1876960 [Rhizophagus irregularis DAOM 181602=DAOM 197198]
MSLSILSTLIANLPNESKNLLYENKIFISTPTLNSSSLFNYAEFCKVLSINKIVSIIKVVINDRYGLVVNEIIKMFTNEITSLEKFTYYYEHYSHSKIFIPYFPGAKDLSVLCCSSNIPSNFFFKLSQISHNLQTISILFEDNISNGLKELIFSQNKLKNLTLSTYDRINWEIIIPAVIKHSQTITKLQLYSDDNGLPFSFVNSFTNLQKFIFSFIDGVIFEDFKKLQYANFPKLEILKIPYQCPKSEYIIKFLENNGKNLKMFYVESIKIWCGNGFLIKKEVLETVVNHSPSNFHELKMFCSSSSDVSPEDWESFFIGWKNRIPKKLLSLTFIDYIENNENLEILKKYKNLGIIKFWTKGFEEEEMDEESDYYQ